MMVGQENKWNLSSFWFLWTLIYQGGKPLIFLSLLSCSLLSTLKHTQEHHQRKKVTVTEELCRFHQVQQVRCLLLLRKCDEIKDVCDLARRGSQTLFPCLWFWCFLLHMSSFFSFLLGQERIGCSFWVMCVYQMGSVGGFVSS